MGIDQWAIHHVKKRRQGCDVSIGMRAEKGSEERCDRLFLGRAHVACGPQQPAGCPLLNYYGHEQRRTLAV